MFIDAVSLANNIDVTIRYHLMNADILYSGQFNLFHTTK